MTHTRKILSQAGVSLADSYDIEGSIVGIDELDASDVKLVHEMGGTIMSERMNTLIIKLATGDLNQNDAWEVTGGALPETANRILGVFVTADVTARIGHCCISLGDTVTSEEIPFWTWDINADVDKGVRWREGAAAVANVRALVPSQPTNVPNLGIKMGSAGIPPQLIFRGLVVGFGAGTVEVIMNVLLARASQPVPTAGEPKGHGLPLPGW